MAINIKSKKILSPENISKIVMMGLSLKDALSIIEQKCLEEYDEVKTYPKDSYVTYDGYLWKSKSTATGSFSELKWNKIGDDLSLVDIDEIKTMINLSNEEIATLQSLILDSQITLSTTFSSSRIYSDIQQSLKDSKTYTLEQLAKKTGATYKVVSGTDEVTSSEYLYLISNGTAYDIYAFIDGNSQKIGDTTIDLSDYAKVSDLDNYYTKSDSDGKFATITTVNGKFDKANINTAISNTPSDEKVLSEKAIKSELDLKANDNEVIKKTDINTTIDSSSTDTQVPSAKSVWDSLYKIRDPQILVDANKPTSRICEADLTTLNTPAKEGLTIAQASLIISANDHDCWNGQISITVGEPSVYVRSVNASSTWTKWRKLCTTGVADVPLTKINIINGIVNPNCNYQVKNGVCYIQLNTGTYSLGENVNGLQLATGLPIPLSGQVANTYVPWASGDASKQVILFVDGVGDLRLHASVGANGCPVFTSFSYPVAES